MPLGRFQLSERSSKSWLVTAETSTGAVPIRHPDPASFEDVHRDLGVVFAAVVVALDLVVIVWWLLLGGWTPQMLVALVVLLLIDAGAAAVLKSARSSIARAWVEGCAVAERAAPMYW